MDPTLSYMSEERLLQLQNEVSKYVDFFFFAFDPSKFLIQFKKPKHVCFQIGDNLHVAGKSSNSNLLVDAKLVH